MSSKLLPETLKNTIVIAGGTGLVARSLKYAFESIGCSVIVISNQDIPGAVKWHQLKTTGLPSHVSAVINTCGNNIFSPTPFSQSFIDQLYESRVGTNLILRDAIVKAKIKPKSFITMSGVGCYKTDPSIEHDENSQAFNNDLWADLVKKWEAATELPADFDTRRIMIRSGVILSRHGGMVKNMYPSFQIGLGGPLGSGEQYIPLIHIKDLMKLIIFCAEMPNVHGVINAVAPVPCKMNEFTKTLAKSMRRPHFAFVPEFLIRTMLAEDRANILLNSVKVVPKKALDLGFEFQYPDCYAMPSGLVESVY